MMNAQITIKRGLSLFLLVFLASPGNLRAQSGWTVDDCMRYAVEQNYRVRNSRLDTRIAGEDLTAAYGELPAHWANVWGVRWTRKRTSILPLPF